MHGSCENDTIVSIVTTMAEASEAVIFEKIRN